MLIHISIRNLNALSCAELKPRWTIWEKCPQFTRPHPIKKVAMTAGQLWSNSDGILIQLKQADDMQDSNYVCAGDQNFQNFQCV